MRIRSIKPEFWRSDDITQHDLADRLLFIGLWSYVDDNGVGRDSLAHIAADLFAADLERDSSETFARVSRGLSKLAETGQIVRYKDEGKPLLFIATWSKHQRIDKPGKPRFPAPTRKYGDTPEPVATPSRDTREIPAPGAVDQGAGEQGSRGAVAALVPRGEATNRGHRLPDGWMPSPDLVAQMQQECPQVDLGLEHRKFTDYWLAKPGKDAHKLDWDRTWRNWIRSARPSPQRQQDRRQQQTDDIFARAQQWATEQDRKALTA